MGGQRMLMANEQMNWLINELLGYCQLIGRLRCVSFNGRSSQEDEQEGWFR